jgi:hypothetical protein
MPIAVVQIRAEPVYRNDAFVKGLGRHGYKMSPAHTNPTDSRDLLVLWNRKRGADDAKATGWERRGGTVIVAENGYIQKEDKTTYALSVHGHNGAGWFPYDASEDRFSKLGFTLKPWLSGGKRDGYYLVCGQRGIGSPQMASPALWAEKMAKALAAKGLNVRLRQHPGNFPAKTPLSEDLKGAKACVIWSSGSGVKALVEGIPVEFDAPHWICAGAVDEATRAERMNFMAHGQWHFKEIESGEPFARMLANLGDAKW